MIIMAWVRSIPVDNSKQVVMGQWKFVRGRNTIASFGPLQSTGYKRTFACRTDIREMGLELIGNAQKISINRLRIDVGRLESDKKS